MSKIDIEKWFPQIAESGYNVTSPATSDYNCIAWAACDIEAWWWPDQNNQYYWPSNIPRTETLESFIKTYKMLGYSLCDNTAYEAGFEKIAIYVNANGKPTHAARQLSSGNWTSKLGKLEDIEHTTLDSLSSGYGSVAVILKRAE